MTGAFVNLQLEAMFTASSKGAYPLESEWSFGAKLSTECSQINRHG